jgi:hypothetical protein
MPNPKMKQAEQDRASQGQSIPTGDTGDGATGVPAQEQGISNRPGDRDLGGDAEDDVIERSEDRLADDEDDTDEDSDDDASDEPEGGAEKF